MSSILTIALTAAPSLDVTVLSWFNDSHSLWLDVLATYLTAGWTWLPLYIALFILVMKNNETIQQVGLVMGCTLLALILAGGVDNLVVKPLVARPRPSSDPIIKYMVDVVAGYRGKDFSFFSAHAANTMAIATFFIWLVRDKLLSVMLVCWSLINCWTRLHLGMHYPSDIVVGLVWGVISGSVAFFIIGYRRKSIISLPNILRRAMQKQILTLLPLFSPLLSLLSCLWLLIQRECFI